MMLFRIDCWAFSFCICPQLLEQRRKEANKEPGVTIDPGHNSGMRKPLAIASDSCAKAQIIVNLDR